ncbi:MAG: DNA polymerase IV [Spirochaetia bacterium]|jgi:DNA polymerase-4|uniref:DNA polymerase IV n=1 Tax=uncultured Spirochaetota bacterium TaxID=460511 RepID=A0A652ZYT0_9SPIR|nr:DNA polymerase IV [Spirochaetia bacterium]MCE1209039.1 DNA polymerase IV [Spirochaetia bacterium]NLX45794.1 DNA polymerase IV [Treponema sp.]VBB40938.1 DNA polymerase IV [uncultured Spirochaetota bacterium]HOI21994.1 DNA polymerase IV [Spirochaetales bacterium]
MRPCRFHVDLDAFFASVEQIDRPELKGKPVIVGAAPGRRGVVSTCSYEARAFGLHSAMPISEAYRRCPQGVYLPVRMQRYEEISREIMDILKDFTPDLHQLSIDEALMDMTGTERLWGEPENAAMRIKEKIREATGLTISIGVSINSYVAKIASGLRKPDGLCIVREGGEKDFMARLPLEKLWGAGEKTRTLLNGLGIHSVAELQGLPLSLLEVKLGRAAARFLSEAALGRDPGIYNVESRRSSMSGERTFERDTSERQRLIDALRLISDELAARTIRGDSACTLGLKLRFSDFSCIHRQFSRDEAFVSAGEILEGAIGLLDENWDGRRPVRLIGISLQGLKPLSAFQSSLFQEGPSKSEKARRVMQEIDSKGLGQLVRARFLPRDASGNSDEEQ